MKQQPVSPDDLQLTAYALGEMTNSERMEFESRLEESPDALAELEAMDDINSLLSGALRNEWCTEMREPLLEALPAAAEGKVVSGQFRTPKGAYIAAAAAVAALLVAGISVMPKTEVSAGSSFADSPSTTSLDISRTIDFPGLEPGVAVPSLYLTEEVDNPENLDLASALENLDKLASPLDASYLDSFEAESKAAETVLPVSLSSGEGVGRVDSYLPNRAGLSNDGLIEERRTMRVISPGPDEGAVFVRGYVAMDGDLFSAGRQSGDHLLPGFRPVSMVGNPVQETEVDLRLLSELQSIQNELSGIVEKMPSDSERRNQLEAILKRNRDAVKELKSEFSQ
ncbi:MAG: hypothetical protein MI807_07535 [Verrucomicrobiales bacterium]|nr:hypothetical protein [Verrucomicrobiales bacterium]